MKKEELYDELNNFIEENHEKFDNDVNTIACEYYIFKGMSGKDKPKKWKEKVRNNEILHKYDLFLRILEFLGKDIK